MNWPVDEVVLLVVLGLALVVLNLRNTLYMREWWERSGDIDPAHPERSWLLRALTAASAATTIGVFYFLEVTFIGIVLGPQPQLRPVSAIVLIILLLQLWKIGQEFRARHREAELKLRREALHVEAKTEEG